MQTAARSQAPGTQATATVEASTFGPGPNQVMTTVQYGPKCETMVGFGGFAAGFDIEAAAAAQGKLNGVDHTMDSGAGVVSMDPSAMLPNVAIPDIESQLILQTQCADMSVRGKS